MNQRQVRVASLAVVLIVLFPAVFIGFSAPASASIWDWDWFSGGSDGSGTWLPPDQASGMDLSDKEYISLWGGVSVYTEDSSQYDAFESKYKSDFEDEALEQFYAMALGIQSPVRPSGSYLEWNDNAHRLSYGSGEPSHGDVESSYLISDAYIDIVRTDPHAYYDSGSTSWWSQSGGESTKYIGTDAELSYVSDEQISSRPTKRSGRGVGSTMKRYSIIDRDRQTEITARDSSGNMIDQDSTGSSATSVSLDLSSLEADEEVFFDVKKEIEAVEKETRYKRVCTRKKTRCRTTNGERKCSRYCASSEWRETGTSMNYDSVTVEDSCSGVIYDPTVSVSYTTQTDSGAFSEEDFYYFDVESDQPIAGFELPDGGFVSYPYGHATTRDRDYDAALDELTPVEHHVATFKSEPTLHSTTAADLYSFGGESRYYTGSSDYEFDNVDEELTNVDSVRVGGVIENFDENRVSATPIIPTANVNMEFEENSQVEMSGSDLQVQYREEDDGEYTLFVKLQDSQTGEPISTAGVDGLSVTVEHSGSAGPTSVETDSDGQASHTFNAQQGDVFRTEFEQTVESRANSEKIYLDSYDLTEIGSSIEYESTVMNIFSEITWVVIFVFGPGIVLLSAIYYTFTGRFHPF